MSYVDLTNKKFNNLLVVSRVENDKFGNAKWLCECDCGNKVEVLGTHLRSNHTKSCGCLMIKHAKEIKRKSIHNMIDTRIYRIWLGIKNRTNPKSKDIYTTYKNYSGRGIKICEEWKKDFLAFYKWSIENGYNDKLTIDRIDVNGNYEPNNCRWITMKGQNNNKRNNVIIEFNGEKHTLTEWNEKMQFPKGLLKNRLVRGWSIERALTTKAGKRNGY